MNNNRQKQKSGFTLIEVAVVLFIMGIFVSFASTMLRNLGVSNKLRDAREKLTTTSDAVQAWSAKTNPRVIPSLSAINNPFDYWNKPYVLHKYPPVLGAVDDICKLTSTNLSICPGGSCVSTNLTPDIAYVIISGGDNLVVNTLPVISPSPCSSAKPCIPIKDLSTTNDDLFKYVTLAELKKTAGCIEADSRLRILNGDLPSALVGSRYDVSIWADGGQPSGNTYTWSSTPSPPSNLVFNNAYKPDSGPTRFRIYSTPTVQGAYNITLTVQDSALPPVTSTKTFVLTVNSKQ